jgi:hypothetical protein
VITGNVVLRVMLESELLETELLEIAVVAVALLVFVS